MTQFQLTPIQISPKSYPMMRTVSLDQGGEQPVSRRGGFSQIPRIDLNSPIQSNGSLANGDREQVDTGESIRQKIETSAGTIWLEGNTLLCACPDCGASMSIRLFLSAADCWRCETSISLSAEQIAAAEELLDQARSRSPSAASAPTTTTAPVTQREQPAPRPPAERVPEPRRRRTSAQNQTSKRIREIRTRNSPSVLLSRLLQTTPAWLISFVIHFVLMMLLAILWFADDEQGEAITLSTVVAEIDQVGAKMKMVEDIPEYDLPTPPIANLSDRTVQASLAKADQEARELRLDASPRGSMPSVTSVKQRLATATGSNYKFVARDPRIRTDMVEHEGGTMLTEAAVARGLRWLASQQNKDGSWSLGGNNRGDTAATALALLPFLGAGQTHEFGIYKDNVAKGLKWLMEQQKEDGDLRGGLNNQMAMYAHGQSSIVLVEALAMTGDERFRRPAQKAIDFICEAQHKEGGWRYKPGEKGDTSVFGWQMMALQSAASPDVGLNVPEATLKLADYYLDLAASEDGSRYKYQPGGSPTATMTAEGLLCRMYLGWKRDDPRLTSGVNWLVDQNMPTTREKNIYYWYYATQTLHHYGGPRWEKWNEKMRDVLVDLQLEKGSQAGSWDPRGFKYGQGGRIYVTALAVCTLEVYYRHLPLFKQLDIDVDQ